MLSIIIVNWNTRQDLLSCLASIMACPPSVPFEVIVFDNASEDGSPQAVAAAYPQVRLLISNENLGFARGNNRAAQTAQGRYWLLLNPDTMVQPRAIDVLMGALAGQAQVAAVGPQLVNADGTPQPSIERLPSLFNEWWRLFHLDRVYPVSQYAGSALAGRRPQRVEVLSGACLLLQRDALEAHSLFDEDYFVYSEEIDLCDRLRAAGWALQWVPEAVVTHFGGRSTRLAADRMFIELYRNKVKFFRKRRGHAAARLYKLVLLQAALVRFGLSKLASVLPIGRRAELRETGRQYGLLLGQLSNL